VLALTQLVCCCCCWIATNLLQGLAALVKAAASVLVVGGGPLGVELAGEVLTVREAAAGCHTLYVQCTCFKVRPGWTMYAAGQVVDAKLQVARQHVWCIEQQIKHTKQLPQ
jgi:hypothetical protein